MKFEKTLIVKITMPEVVEAFEDIATVRNIREEAEDEIKANWTAERVAIAWLINVATGVTRSHESICECMRRYPSFDWEDVDKLRAERQSMNKELNQ